MIGSAAHIRTGGKTGDRTSSVPYVAPFVVFITLLALEPILRIDPRWQYPAQTIILVATLWILSRKVIDLRVARPTGSVLLGVAVFVIWIGPELLWPGYRSHWLFQNQITGFVHNGIPPEFRNNPRLLLARSFRAIVLVPIIEELFWRAWLMRWLIHLDFTKVPLGAFARNSFWITAVLFASEHGVFWDVGLIAGILYNWWMIRTRRLGDCILAHAVTNACLSACVVFAHQWQYWR